MYWTDGSGLIKLQITKAQAHRALHRGQCDSDIAALRTVPNIRRQLAKLDSAQCVAMLAGYGAWEDFELADHDANLNRILWLACCDIHDGYY
jgi:hypothetical protein